MIDTQTIQSISALKHAYTAGGTKPETLMAQIRQKAEAYASHNIWIHVLSAEEQAPYLERLQKMDPQTTPLWGIPFAIKDNIDLAGIPTTAACKAFTYTPSDSAFVVQQLLDAGAIPVGKTNLDQFATGLNGTRSPWGACKNAFNDDYISGGSSSGSAVAVALGMASFSLGTDTAGSGRVPACFNGLIGVKPSRGLLSSTGMVPACRSLDCMTIFTQQLNDANLLLSIAEGQDKTDPFSRANPFANQSRQFGKRNGPLKIGVIPDAQLQFFGDDAYQAAYAKSMEQLSQQAEIELIEFDYAPFDEAAKLLYEGPWVAERYIATTPLIEEQPEAIFPVVRDIISQGNQALATDLFKAQYRLEGLKSLCGDILQSFDCILTPTAGCCFTIEEMLEEPILRNSQLGYYTNFMNLLDLSSLAVPTQTASNGLPFGLTLVGPCFSDRRLLSIAARLSDVFAPLSLDGSEVGAIAETSTIDVMVCGAHLSGMPLNWQLIERGATLKQSVYTSAKYRMYALAGGPPFRPGLILDSDAGAKIEVEVWSVPACEFGSFVAGIPAPLGIGKVELENGEWVSGFICEPYGIEGAQEITKLGGWRAYIAQKTR